MAERHALMAKNAATSVVEKKLVEIPDTLPVTKSLYYEDVKQREFDASVLYCGPLSGDDLPESATHGIILDRTCFYPEGGGQEGDHGCLSTDSNIRNILDTRISGSHIVHLADGAFEVGDLVHGSLDWDRRKQLMDHHTSCLLYTSPSPRD